MALEFNNTLISTNKVLFDEVEQNIIEGDVIVPDVKPDVLSIINVNGKAFIKSKEIHKDTVVLRGGVDFRILYLSDDPSRKVCSIDHTVTFDNTVNASNLDSEMKCRTSCNIEHVECNILNGRKLNVKAIMNSGVKIEKQTIVNAISGINEGENIQVLNKNVEFIREGEHEPINQVLTYEVDVPLGKTAVRDVLRTDVVVKEKEVKVTGEKVIAKGILEIRSLYTSDMEENAVDFIVNEVPFSEVLDLENIGDYDEFDLLLQINEVSVKVREDEDGDTRVLVYDISTDFTPITIEKQSIDILEDAYGLNSNLVMEKTPVRIMDAVCDARTQLTLRETLSLNNMRPLKEVYSIQLNPIISEVKLENDKINVAGNVDLSMVYLSETDKEPISAYEHSIPFSTSLDVKGVKDNVNADINAIIEDYSLDVINPSAVEAKLILSIKGRLMAEKNIDVITGVEEMPLDEASLLSQPSMTVYYVQNGDSLWAICKRYNTTLDALMKLNELQDESIRVGQQLLIPKASKI